MKKEVIKQAVDQYLPELVKITDEIYDLAEPGMEEIMGTNNNVEIE